MRGAQTITVPDPENLPFINQMFADSAEKVEDDRKAMDADVWPGISGEGLIGAMKALSPATFLELFKSLRPTVFDKPILTPQDLKDVIVEQPESISTLFIEDSDFKLFTDEQLQIWLLYSARYPKDIDWRKVATLFNHSSDDQCTALDGFFWEFRRLGLGTLLSQKGLDLAVPECLTSNKSRLVDDETQVFCERTQEWLRDDVFHARFKVCYKEGFDDFSSIGYAGTVHQAIAKAIVHARSKDGAVDVPSNGMGRLIAEQNLSFTNGTFEIHYEDKLVIQADLTRSLVKLPDASNVQQAKLAWGERQAGPFSEQYIRKALWATEKLFGLQWSKVRHLENDLGM